MCQPPPPPRAQQRPNQLLPLSKRRRVTEWYALGLEPMAEPEDHRASSDVDFGGGGFKQRGQ